MASDLKLFTLKELCNILSISLATGRNWVKLNKIVPTKNIKNVSYFSESYIHRLKKELVSGNNAALKNRRNKGFISGNGIYKSYLSSSSVNNRAVRAVFDILSKENIMLSNEQIHWLVAECALQLFCKRFEINATSTVSLLYDYLSGELDITPYASLVDDLISSPKSALAFIEEHPQLFVVSYTYEAREDILGLLYISLKNMNSRKATGSYYTPTETVQQLIGNLSAENTDFTQKTIFDPCCGTGNFLLQLPDYFDFTHIYGNDIDSTSVKITRVNMALKFHIRDMQTLYANITESDFLTEPSTRTYDYIIGNPPWGFVFSDAEKDHLRENFQCAKGKNIESYDVFTERALSLLSENGTLAFILPKAILNVRNHTAIRQIILEKTSITRLDYLGEIFNKVQCPSIIMQLVHTGKPFSVLGMTVTDPTHSFTIHREREITPNCFSFLMNDREYAIMDKLLHLPSAATLKNQADFALGIVTGNNREYISNEKTDTNEIILRGSDIERYQIKEVTSYITFTPENFQQTAQEKYYRAPEKLLYRFISKEPVFTYDDKQTLSLNSCNILIPHVEGLDMKYILAVLNSRIAQFIFRKQFDSVKVLRSHIEQIPIPVIDSAAQMEIIRIVNRLLSEKNDAEFLAQYEKLDKLIAALFRLTEEEYQIICAP